MKYGVIVCKETDNIGDDIQSYAAMCQLPHADYFIEREHLDVFRPEEAEPVHAILNGWLMNNKLGWPVSPFIDPLYTSMHFVEHDDLHIDDLFLTGLGGEDLRAHQPVGCRDTASQEMLKRNGIESYFSGCMTLTLPRKFPKTGDAPYVCLTDVPDEVEAHIRKRYPELNIRIIHQVPMVERNAAWEKRFQNVEALLTVYQNASAVITTRVHCAMPCLALETPVLFLREDAVFDKGRLDGLWELAHHATVSELVTDQVDFDLRNPPENPDACLALRKSLVQRVQDWLKGIPPRMPELKRRMAAYDGEWEKRALWKDGILLQLDRVQGQYWATVHERFEEMAKGKAWLEDQVKWKNIEIDRLNGVITDVKDESARIWEANKWLEKEKNWRDSENVRLTAERDQLAETNASLTAERDQLAEANACLTAERDDEQQKNAALLTENAQLRDSVTRAVTESWHAADRAEQAETQLQALQATLQQTCAELAAAETRMAQALGQQSELPNDAAIDGRISALHARIDQLIATNRSLDQQLHQIPLWIRRLFIKTAE